jgi:2-polyprenyl-6-hydroxyphenyl methylase/3-demethylubiquinone-9 3-methyltransferase
VLDRNRKTFFPEIPDEHIASIQGSIVDPRSIQTVQNHSFSKAGRYEIVHSWGVLHHSGAMFQAIKNSAQLVASHGYLILAVYQTHWSSPLWKLIKYIYNRSPAPIQRLLVQMLYPVIYLAKWMVTGKDPKQKNRGMEFYHDVVDWVGGYPYEYSTRAQIISYLKGFGFELVRFYPPSTPTGCMEFVFQRTVC